MVRSLAVVFALVIPLWFFGQASSSDSKKIRPVDPTEALQAFAADTKAPVPTAPAGYVVNVVAYEQGALRIGYVHGDDYQEFAGGSGAAFLSTYAGKGSVEGTVDVAGVTWQRYVGNDGHVSLVRQVSGTTLLVGGVRENVTDAELIALASTVR